MFEPSARAETVMPPRASPPADLIVPDSTASAACAAIGLSAVADMATANTAPRPNLAKLLVFLMAVLLMRPWRVSSWSYRGGMNGGRSPLFGGGRCGKRWNRLEILGDGGD